MRKDNNFFLANGVGNCGRTPIEIRFDTLIEANCQRPFDWYQALGLDKSDASKIRRGLIIPPEWLRIKIASFFKTDSSTIWKIPEILSADQLINKRGEVEGSEPSSPNSSKINEGDSNASN